MCLQIYSILHWIHRGPPPHPHLGTIKTAPIAFFGFTLTDLWLNTCTRIYIYIYIKDWTRVYSWFLFIGGGPAGKPLTPLAEDVESVIGASNVCITGILGAVDTTFYMLNGSNSSLGQTPTVMYVCTRVLHTFILHYYIVIITELEEKLLKHNFKNVGFLLFKRVCRDCYSRSSCHQHWWMRWWSAAIKCRYSAPAKFISVLLLQPWHWQGTANEKIKIRNSKLDPARQVGST